MHRKTWIGIVLALCAALAMTGTVAAKGPSAPGASGTHASGHGSGSATASLTVKGNASHPGGVFRVLAVLHAPKDLRPPTVNAVVHFATGDVAIVLTRSGQGAAYHGNVPVPAGEPAGVVKIDATAVVNGATLTATGSGKIVVETTSETSETSTTTTETTTTCTVTTTETVTTTVTITVSETSTATETTDTDQSSEASESSEASQSEDNHGDSCDQDSADAASFDLTPHSMRQVFAFLRWLFD